MHYVLRVEELESRCLLATVTWISNQAGDWETPANWSSNNVPTAIDDVIIAAQTGLCTLSTNGAAKSIVIEENGRLRLEAPLVVANNVENSGSLTLRPLAVLQSPSVNIYNMLFFEGGSITGDLTNGQDAIAIGSSLIVYGNVLNSGILYPQLLGGSVSVIGGNFMQNPSGVLKLDATRNGCGRVTVTGVSGVGGTAFLGGTLEVNVIPGQVVPIRTNEFTVVNYENLGGYFLISNWPIGQFTFTGDYQPTKLLLSVPKLQGAANNFNVGVGVAISGNVGTCVDNYATGLTGSDYTASIDWGDGTQTTGTLTEAYYSNYGILTNSSHAYASAGTYALSITVTEMVSDVIFELTPGTVTVYSYGGGGGGYGGMAMPLPGDSTSDIGGESVDSYATGSRLGIRTALDQTRFDEVREAVAAAYGQSEYVSRLLALEAMSSASNTDGRFDSLDSYYAVLS